MNKDGWIRTEGGWTTEASQLEWAAKEADRAPVDPWGNTIFWSEWEQEWNRGDLACWRLLTQDPETQEAVKLVIFND